jgi:hypothetical protein
MRERFRSSRSGQALIEFALILPILALMLWVIFDLGRAIYYYSQVYNAAREGARCAIVIVPGEPHPCNIEDEAKHLGAAMDITVSSPTYTDDTITVTVTYIYKPASPVLELLLNLTGDDAELTLTSTATMQKEY